MSYFGAFFAAIDVGAFGFPGRKEEPGSRTLRTEFLKFPESRDIEQISIFPAGVEKLWPDCPSRTP